MITNVSTKNFRGREALSLNLFARTNLKGPSGSGKSLIRHAIEISLSGHAGTGKKPSAILAMATDASCEISIQAGDHILTRTFEANGTEGKQSIILNGFKTDVKKLSLPADLAIPTEGIHPSEFLGLSGDKRAEWLFSALSSDTATMTIGPKDFPKPPAWLKGVMPFAQFFAELDKRLKADAEEEKRCLANLQRLMGIAEDLPAGTESEWREKLAVAEKALDTAIKEHAGAEKMKEMASVKEDHIKNLNTDINLTALKIHKTQDKIDLSRKRLETAFDELVELGLEARSPTGEVERIERETSNARNELAAKNAQMENLEHRLEKLKGGICPICETAVSNLKPILGEMEFELKGLQGQTHVLSDRLTRLLSDQNKFRRGIDLQKEIKDIELAIKVDSDGLKSYKKTLERFEDGLKVARESFQGIPDLSKYEKTEEAARQKKSTIAETLAKFTALSGVRTQKAKAEADRSKLVDAISLGKELKSQAKDIRNKRLENLVSPFRLPLEKLVAECFPGNVAYLELFDSKENISLDFGLEAGKKRRSFEVLSGGERAVFLAAVIGAIQTIRCGSPKLCLAELAEADDNLFQRFSLAVEKIGFEQVIIASCHGKDLPGWINIDMGAVA
jgi:hypothetical protein